MSGRRRARVKVSPSLHAPPSIPLKFEVPRPNIPNPKPTLPWNMKIPDTEAAADSKAMKPIHHASVPHLPLSSWQRGGWKQDHPHLVSSRVDTGRRKNTLGNWEKETLAYVIPTEATTNTTTAKHNDTANLSKPMDRVITARSDAAKEILSMQTPTQHTPIVRLLGATSSSSSSSLPTAPDTASTPDAAAASLLSPRLRRLHSIPHESPPTSSARHVSIFTNSHHFDTNMIPTPQQALTVPVILLPQQQTTAVASNEEKQSAATDRSHLNRSNSTKSHTNLVDTPSGSATSRLVFDPEFSTLQVLPLQSNTDSPPQHTASSSSLQPSASLTSFALSSSSSTADIQQQQQTTTSHQSSTKHFVRFSPDTSQANLHEPVAAAIAPSASSSSLLSPQQLPVKLSSSVSAGQLPFGLSPSPSYGQIHIPKLKLFPHTVQSSPSMPRFGATGVAPSSSQTSLLGSSPSASNAALHAGMQSSSATASATDLTSVFAAHTIDNSMLIAEYLRVLLKQKGYKYRMQKVKSVDPLPNPQSQSQAQSHQQSAAELHTDATMRTSRSEVTLKGDIDESSDEDTRPARKRRKKKQKAKTTEQDQSATHREQSKKTTVATGSATARSSSSSSSYPRPSWDKGTFDELRATLPFAALFGKNDSLQSLRAKKRAQYIEREQQKQAEGKKRETQDEEVNWKMRDRQGGDARQGSETDEKQDSSRRSHILVPAHVNTNDTQDPALQPLASPLTLSRVAIDPLNPVHTPNLVVAAARVLLRKDLHPASIDANQVQVVNQGTKKATTLLGANQNTNTNTKKSMHELLQAKIGGDEFSEDALVAYEQKAISNHLLPKKQNKKHASSKYAIDSNRAAGTFLEHSSKGYNIGSSLSAAAAAAAANANDVASSLRPSHGPHNSQTFHTQQHGSKQDAKSEMLAWLTVRKRRHKNVLKEEDRLRAREMFDMLLLAAAIPPSIQHSQSGSSTSQHRKRHGSSFSSSTSANVSSLNSMYGLAALPPAEDILPLHTFDPQTAKIDIHAMTAALNNLGMNATTEEIAFRLQRIKELKETERKNAVAGIARKKQMHHQLQVAKVDSNNAGAAKLKNMAKDPTTTPASTSLDFSFSDFLNLYGHINDWDEVFTYKQHKRSREMEEKLREKEMERMEKAREGRKKMAALQREEKETASVSVSPPTSPRGLKKPASTMRSPSSAMRNDTARTSSAETSDSEPAIKLSFKDVVDNKNEKDSPQAKKSANASSKKVSDVILPSLGQSSSTASLPPAAGASSPTSSSSAGASASADPSQPVLTTRVDDRYRQIELPFFLWVPAAHRNEKINELIHVYGRPSQIGVGIYDSKEKRNAVGRQSSSMGHSSSLKRLQSHQRGDSSIIRKASHAIRQRVTGSSNQHHNAQSVDSDSSSGVDSDGGSSSSEEDVRTDALENAKLVGSPGVGVVVRNLVDELNPNKATASKAAAANTKENGGGETSAGDKLTLPAIIGATGMSDRDRKTSIALRSQQTAAALRKKLKRKARRAAALQPSLSKATNQAYWGSAQVLRALHFKNMGLSTSTLRKESAVLTHETVAPTINASKGARSSVSSTASGTPHRSTSQSPTGERADTAAAAFTDNNAESSLISHTTAGGTVASSPTRSLHPQVHERVQSLKDHLDAGAERAAIQIAAFVKQVEEKLKAKFLAIEQAEAEGVTPAEGESILPPENGKIITGENSTPAPAAAATATTTSPAKAEEAAKAEAAATESDANKLPVICQSLLSSTRNPRRASFVGALPKVVEKQLEVATVQTVAPRRSTALAPIASAAISSALAASTPAATVTAAAAATASDDGEKLDKNIMQLTDPMVKAAKSGLWEDVLMLIQTTCGDNVKLRNAYVNRRDRNGSSAIMHTVWPGHFRALEVLLYHGADPNVQNNRLNTALHLCCEKGHRKLIRLLIEMGASIELKNWQNKTPLDVIPVEEDAEIIAATAAAVQAVDGAAAVADGSNTQALVAATSRTTLAEPVDSLRNFVLECAAEAKRKREREKEESNAGGIGQVSAMVGAGVLGAAGGDFVEYASRRDAVAHANAIAASQAAVALSLLGPDGKPAVDLWSLTAEDRRSAGIRGNFFGSNVLHQGGVGQHQSRSVISGEYLIHSHKSALGASANSNAMGSYKAQFLQLSDPVALEQRNRIIAGLVREELAHASLHSLWLKTQKEVQSRKTVIASTEDLLDQEGGRLDKLRSDQAQRQQLNMQ